MGIAVHRPGKGTHVSLVAMQDNLHFQLSKLDKLYQNYQVPFFMVLPTSYTQLSGMQQTLARACVFNLLDENLTFVVSRLYNEYSQYG